MFFGIELKSNIKFCNFEEVRNVKLLKGDVWWWIIVKVNCISWLSDLGDLKNLIIIIIIIVICKKFIVLVYLIDIWYMMDLSKFF